MKAKPRPRKAKAAIQPSFLGDLHPSSLHFARVDEMGIRDHCSSVSSVAAGQVLSMERVETKCLGVHSNREDRCICFSVEVRGAKYGALSWGLVVLAAG